MFKPFYGNCTCCGETGLIVVKRGLRDICNHRLKQGKKATKTGAAIYDAFPPETEAGGQDIEGYTNVYRAPIQKKKLQSGRKRVGKDQVREKVDFGKTSGLQGITKEHTLVYMKAFGYTIADFVPCEVTGQRCCDVHHIYARGMGGSDLEDKLYNRIENLMGLTREYHVEYGDKDQYYGFLIQRHFEFLSANGVPYDKHFFDKWPTG